MKKLVLLLMLLPLLVKAQYCSVATTNVAITPTTTTQYTATYSSGIRAFNFAATAGCTYTFSTCGFSTIDTYLRLYSTGTGGTLLASSDDYCSVQSQITWTCPTTGTYSILLTKFSCVALTAATYMSYIKSCPATNDNCANAIAITLPYTSPVTSNVGSTDDVPTSATGCGTQGSNLWYSVVGNNTTYTATTCNASTNFDTEVRVYTGTCSALNSMVEIVCNDDATCASYSLASSVSWCAYSGTTYYISVGYYASGVGTGNFVLNVSSNNTPCSTLPIDLMWFDAWWNGKMVEIDWATASETDNDYFTVEKLDSNFEWKHLATIEGAGTTSSPHLYEVNDSNPVVGYNYYRLRQTDYNGVTDIFAPKVVYVPAKYREVDYYVNVLGQVIQDLENYHGLYLIIYKDGFTEKRIKD